MEFSITLVIVIVTVLTSIGAMSNQKMMDDMIFYPPAISQRQQYYRFITHGFIHADAAHLIFNMIALWSFSTGLENVLSFECVFGRLGKTVFILMYFTALIVASIPDYLKYKENYQFRSLGASGAVSAIIFSMIVFFPQTPIGIIFIPVAIPGWIFGLLYLGISAYLDKRGGGRINHSAHFWGAAYGIVVSIVLCQLFANNFDVYENFVTQIKSESKDMILQCK